MFDINHPIEKFLADFEAFEHVRKRSAIVAGRDIAYVGDDQSLEATSGRVLDYFSEVSVSRRNHEKYALHADGDLRCGALGAV